MCGSNFQPIFFHAKISLSIYFSFFSSSFTFEKGSDHYAIAVGQKDLPRLEILNEIYNPPTLVFLKEQGLKEGMSVLDVGSGPALLSCKIAHIVTSQGKVVGIDKAPEQLKIAAACILSKKI